MFVDEARLVSRISHPNVVQVIDLGKVGRSYYIAMEYVEGESAAALLRRTQPPRRLSARIIANAASGLHAAHELRDQGGKLYNVVHRDVSPHNVLIGYNGTAKVVDFGVARAKGSLHTTKDGALKGKYGYMAPEQVSPSMTVDRRADIFALGIVLYEMTTRRRLFRADSDTETLGRVLECNVVPPSEIDKSYPADLERIVLRALQREPKDRYKTAQHLQEDLERYIAASGDPVLSHHVAGMMRKVFADRIKKKKRIIENFNEDSEGSVPDVDLLTSLSDRLEEMEAISKRRQRRLILGMVAVLALALGVVALVLLLSGDPRKTVDKAEEEVPRGGAGAAAVANRSVSTTAAEKGGTANADARQVSILVKISPDNATLQVDGKAVTNPYTYDGPPREGTVTATASAAGYLQRSFKIDLKRGGKWILELRQSRPQIRKRSTKRTTKASRRRSKKRSSLRDEDVMSNPYGK
jgi:serine/threonine protein kinase